ncbi:MAG: glycosyltransferase family 39 protein [Patescibacteria group bacterium]
MNKEASKSKEKYFFWLIFVAAFGFRFWGLNSFEMQQDPALNSMRALGWFDFLVGVGQTSPLVWFGHIPWWGNLSFHDHPPVSFFLQFLTFKIFGDHTFTAFLPFLLAGVLTAAAIFIFIKKFKTFSAAFFSALLFAFSSYSVWASRTGYLEGLELFFIILSILFLLSYVFYKKSKYLYYWAAAATLAVLTKYTAIFLFPAAILFLLLSERRVFKTKAFLLSLILILVILAPVIVYNIEVFLARGHFDAAFSSMVGMKPQDYEVLSYREVNVDVFGNLKGIFEVLRQNLSIPYFITFLFGLGWALFKIIKRKADNLILLLVLNLLLMFLMFAFSGAGARFLGITTPFLSILTVLGFLDALEYLKKFATARKLLISIGVLVLAFELFFSVNTNILKRPVLSSNYFYSPDRFYSHGFEEMDRFFRKEILGPFPKLKRTTVLTDETTTHDLKNRDAILVDERADWFSRVWYVDRYVYYYNSPFVYFSDLNRAAAQGKAGIFELLRKAGARSTWLVIAKGDNIVSREKNSYNDLLVALSEKLEQDAIAPVREIRDYKGQVVFAIYHVK